VALKNDSGKVSEVYPDTAEKELDFIVHSMSRQFQIIILTIPPTKSEGRGPGSHAATTVTKVEAAAASNKSVQAAGTETSIRIRARSVEPRASYRLPPHFKLHHIVQ
jgi:hypothetical protein